MYCWISASFSRLSRLSPRPGLRLQSWSVSPSSNADPGSGHRWKPRYWDSVGRRGRIDPAAILSPAFHRGWVSLPPPPILHRFLASPDAWGN